MCASMMQINLEIQDANVLESLSPPLSLPEGCKSWTVIMQDGSIIQYILVSTIRFREDYSTEKWKEYIVLWIQYISFHAFESNIQRLLCDCLHVVLTESSRKLDNADHWGLLTLMLFIHTYSCQ